jgi:hypothetical protein
VPGRLGQRSSRSSSSPCRSCGFAVPWAKVQRQYGPQRPGRDAAAHGPQRRTSCGAHQEGAGDPPGSQGS